MRIVHRLKDVVFRFDAPTPHSVLPEGYEHVQLDLDNFAHFFERDDVEQWRREAYPRLLERGCHANLIHRGDKWAAIQWIAVPGSSGPPHLPPHLVEERYWCFYEHTRVGHRRLGLWSALKGLGIEWVRETSGDPAREIFSDTEPGNVPSRRAHEAFGFVPDGVISRTLVRVPFIHTFTWGSWALDAAHPPINTVAESAS